MVFWVEQFVDKLISICMIFFLILGTIMFAAVIAIQVHCCFICFSCQLSIRQWKFYKVQRESLHLVQVSGDLVNDAMNEYPEFFKWVWLLFYAHLEIDINRVSSCNFSQIAIYSNVIIKAIFWPFLRLCLFIHKLTIPSLTCTYYI